MKGIMIVAASENNVIGKDNKIPWYIPEDMKRFKSLTLDHPVIMGKNTWISIPEKFKPLAQRKNIILSSSLEPGKGFYVAKSIEESLGLTEKNEYSANKYYVMGGESVYDQFLPLVDQIELTRVHTECEGDSFFPDIDLKYWKLSREEKKRNEKDGIEYSFMTYLKR